MFDAPRLHDHSLNEADRAVLVACARDRRQNCIHVKPLGRFGYTQARLFDARFDSDGIGAPYVIKIDSSANIEREFDALTSAARYFHDALAFYSAPEPENGKAAIIYRLFARSDGNIKELREEYVHKDTNDDDLCRSVEMLYSAFTAAHRPKLCRKKLKVEYIRYLRENRPDRIKDSLSPDDRTIDFLGAEYRNPILMLQEILEREVNIASGFVHGDLHPNNVVLQDGRTPSLIDFAWAHDGDIFADFVLMECSVRFLLFPHHVNWSQNRWVAQKLAQEDGCQEVLGRYESDRSLIHGERYRRMARVVAVIRSAAKKHAGELYDFNNYLAAQYVMLYGLSKLDVYPFFQVLDALAIVGEELAGGG
ncbi:phosphotransferase [Nocardia sp. NPDC006044]|uniref:phosphotransferase n=1 Tax=Nocardia sp. NPDC006044 TaxID=3364306 RepID=UPI00367541ED